MEPLLVELAGEDGHRILLKVEGRLYPQRTDFEDGNWLRAWIEVRLGAFSGRIRADLRSEEFARFGQQLQLLYETLEGEARLDSLETWLSVGLIGDGAGHIVASGFVVDQPGVGNRLSFSFRLDQSYLPPLIDQLQQVEATYPVVGRL